VFVLSPAGITALQVGEVWALVGKCLKSKIRGIYVDLVILRITCVRGHNILQTTGFNLEGQHTCSIFALHLKEGVLVTRP
jgi:hypothetical protein